MNEDSSSPEPEPRIEKASIVKHKKVKSSSVFDGGLWWRRVERSIVLLEAYKGSFFLFVSTASGALVVGGVRDIYMYVSPEIGLSVQWSRGPKTLIAS